MIKGFLGPLTDLCPRYTSLSIHVFKPLLWSKITLWSIALYAVDVMLHCYVYYSCRCEWGEGKALPVIVPSWSRCWKGHYFAALFLSPHYSFSCLLFTFLTVGSLNVIQPYLAHLASKPACPWTAIRIPVWIAPSFCFTPVKNRATEKFADVTFYSPIISM